MALPPPPGLGYALSKMGELLKIKHKTFVLSLIKRRHFFGTPSMALSFCSVDSYNYRNNSVKLPGVEAYSKLDLQERGLIREG